MECSNAIDRLIEYLLTREPSAPAIPDEVVAHIAGCRTCIEELEAISSALTGEPSTLKTEAGRLLPCQECLDVLPAYVEDQVAGEDVARLYPQIERHLQGCAGCREHRALLYEMMQPEAAGAFGQAPSYMTFEEWFRKSAVPLETGPARPFWWDELGRLIIEFSAELVRAFQPPADQLAYAVVKSAKSSRVLCQLSLKEVSEDLEVSITAEEMRDDPTLCTVIVEANIPSRGGWPNLADTEVTLKRGELELGTQVTDAFGEAVFEGINTDDLADLVFEITPQA